MIAAERASQRIRIVTRPVRTRGRTWCRSRALAVSDYPWFCMFTDSRTDHKLSSLTDAQFRIWHRLLCYSAERKKRGVIADVPESLIAIEVCGGNVALLRDTCRVLDDLRIARVTLSSASRDASRTVTLSERAVESIVFLNFEKRNGSKVLTDRQQKASERAKRYRLKKRGENEAQVGTNSEMEPENERVTVTRVTLPSRDASRCVTRNITLEEKKSVPPPYSPPPTGEDPSGSLEPFESGGAKPELEPPPNGAIVNDPEDVRRVAAIAEQLFPGLYFDQKVRQWSKSHRMDVMQAALERAAAKGRKRWEFVLGCCRTIEDDGGPTKAPAFTLNGLEGTPRAETFGQRARREEFEARRRWAEAETDDDG